MNTVMSDGGGAAAREIAWEPMVGCNYRDAADRGLLVVAVRYDLIHVVYADGRFEGLDIFQWRDLQPVLEID